ncbi:MAG: hypothetical protein AAF460_14825 [Pseudomonadota bacterium]
MEPIRNPVFTGSHVEFDAVSNGCTRASDFTVQHAVVAGQCRLTVLRKREDSCRKAPSLERYSLAWAAPGICNTTALVFRNPVAADPAAATGSTAKQLD